MTSKNCGCKGKQKQECGEFSGGEDREAKLKHLKECKKNLQQKINEIDEAIKKLE